MRALVWLAACAACGDNLTPELGDARSGSRLKLERYVFDDGSTAIEPASFHDAVRDERCTAQRWSDGHSYCTPSVRTHETVYATDACLSMLGRVDALPTPDYEPAYFQRRFYLNGEWLPSRLFHAGPRTSIPSETWILRDGICIGTPTSDDGAAYYELGLEVDRTELVRIHERTIDGDTRLSLRVLASDDGMRLPVELSDRQLETVCTLSDSANRPSVTCDPQQAIAAAYFHDASCTEVEVGVSSIEPTPTVVFHFSPSSGCTTHYEVGSLTTAPPLYYLAGSNCVAIVPPFGSRLYLVGAPLDKARLERTHDEQEGRRLHPIELAGDGLALADGYVFDRDLGADCRPELVGDGTRCIPAAHTFTEHRYIDDQCTIARELVPVGTGSCDRSLAFYRRPGVIDFAIHALGAPYTGPLYHFSTGDRCLPFLPDARNVLHDIGAVVPMSMFSSAVLTPDP